MESTLRLSFDIRAGLLIRQIHHWAALTFCGFHWSAHASCVLRVPLNPGRLTGFIGFLLLFLPWQRVLRAILSRMIYCPGNGSRIIDGMLLGIPFVGTWLSFPLVRW